jgi:hypothetical protein
MKPKIKKENKVWILEWAAATRPTETDYVIKSRLNSWQTAIEYLLYLYKVGEIKR